MYLYLPPNTELKKLNMTKVGETLLATILIMCLYNEILYQSYHISISPISGNCLVILQWFPI